MRRGGVMTKQQLKALTALRDVMLEFDIEIYTTASSVILLVGYYRIDVNNNGDYLAINHLTKIIQENDSEK